MSADIIPFRSRFDIEAESTIGAALFGPDDSSSSSNEARKRFIRRRKRLFGIGKQYQVPNIPDTSAIEPY
jgi:hypothetical protein